MANQDQILNLQQQFHNFRNEFDDLQINLWKKLGASGGVLNADKVRSGVLYDAVVDVNGSARFKTVLVCTAPSKWALFRFAQKRPS